MTGVQTCALPIFRYMSSKLLAQLDETLIQELDLRSCDYYSWLCLHEKHDFKGVKRCMDTKYSTEDDKLQQSLKNGICGQFANLWDKKEFCDFTIVVGSKEFHVHKCILSAQSSTFVTLLSDDEEVKVSNKLEIKDYSEEVVEDFLRCLYTGEIENEENALELFSLASTFKVQQLQDLCIKYIARALNNSNADNALQLGCVYKSQKLVRACFDKIKEIFPGQQLAESLKDSPEALLEIVKAFKTCQLLNIRAKNSK